MPPTSWLLAPLVILSSSTLLLLSCNNATIQKGLLGSFFENPIRKDGIVSIQSTATRLADVAAPALITAIIAPNLRHFENKTLHVCGFDRGDLINHLFPELKHTSVGLELNTTSSENSLLVYGLYGPCPLHRKPKRYDIGTDWIVEYYKGKTLSINGEGTLRAQGFIVPANLYQIGMAATTSTTNSVQVLFCAMSLIGHYPEQQWQRLFSHSLKPQSRRLKFCIYAVTNCVDFREEAVDAIASLYDTNKTVSQGGRCKGKNGTLLEDLPWQSKKQVGPRSAKWAGNVQLYRDYRFCLVMENEAVEGYITEKILNAFLAGCIPIYYGTEQVFRVFNRKSFVYYNISNPAPALARIRELEDDTKAYRRVTQEEPILANGNATMEMYFSLADHVGGGILKSKIRAMLAA